MNKHRLWVIVLMLGLLAAFSVGATGGPPELKVQQALGVTEAPGVHRIPVGSTVIHLADGSTTVTGPDGRSVISVKSSEVALIPAPEGMAPATRVYEVPSGSFVHGVSPDTIEIYDADGMLILTVIDQAGEAGSEAVQTNPPAYSDWIEDAHWGYRSYGYFTAKWIVPVAPINSWIDDDVVYLFNGIYGPGANAWAGKRNVILQPVVGFNDDGWWPGNPLNGRVWMVASKTEYIRTAAVDVAVGNIIYGEIQKYPGQTLWQATLYNRSTGWGTVLVTDLLGTTGQAVTVALEGYNLENDSDLFGTTDFVQMHVEDPNYATLYPSWSGRVWYGTDEYFDDLEVIIYDYSHVRLQTAR